MKNLRKILAKKFASVEIHLNFAPASDEERILDIESCKAKDRSEGSKSREKLREAI
jgi:hypothetical protein